MTQSPPSQPPIPPPNPPPPSQPPPQPQPTPRSSKPPSQTLTPPSSFQTYLHKFRTFRTFQQFKTTHPRTTLLLQLTSTLLLLPSLPLYYWSHTTNNERLAREQEVRSKIRIPSVQTVDELMIEKCQPGDVILFDRRCECCAAGATAYGAYGDGDGGGGDGNGNGNGRSGGVSGGGMLASAAAALNCYLGKRILCREDDGTRSVESGTYEHCGIVVPGPSSTPSAQHDPTNLCLLEATSGSGVVCRPLLTRLEMSRSRSVILLPLSCPGERRGEGYEGYEFDHEVEDEDEEGHTSSRSGFLSWLFGSSNDDMHLAHRRKQRQQKQTQRQTTLALQRQTSHQLTLFRDKFLATSQTTNYSSHHSFLSLMGSLLYATNLYPTFPIPVSPSAWLVVQALQECGAAEKLSEGRGGNIGATRGGSGSAKEVKVEDFTRDGRFYERECVRLRPGWKFLSPVVMRETSVS